MICTRKNGDSLEKYEVSFDKDKLEELLNRVIIRCGELHHEKKECEYQCIPKSNSYINDNGDVNIIHYENVKAKKNGKITTHYYEYTPCLEALYDCEYNKYIAPYFAYFIKRIMSLDTDALSILFNRDISSIKYFPIVEEKIESLSSKLSELESKYAREQKDKLDAINKKYSEVDFSKSPDNYKKISKLIKELKSLEKITKKEISKMKQELSSLLRIRELNKNQEHIDEYFNELISLVEFRLIDRIEISEVERVSSFLGQKTLDSEQKLALVK